MAIHNEDIATALEKVGDLLDIAGANQFRVRSYQQAARSLRNESRSLAQLYEEGENLSELPDIGSSMAEKITELIETGRLQQLEDLQEEIPPSVLELLELSELGPKRIQSLRAELGIETIDQLEEAARSGKIKDIDGFGEKTEQNVLEEIERYRRTAGTGRIGLATAEEYTLPLVEHLRQTEGVEEVTAAGSFRRRKETVGDIDILISCRDAQKAMARFVGYEEVDRVVSQGETRSTVLLRSGLQVDARVVEQKSYGAALYYFTGSKEHNVATRRIAAGRGLKLNEYGVFDGERYVAGKTEGEVFSAIDLPWIPPELRENRGEVEAARDGRLPDLLSLEDIRGDLQCHSTESDGKNSIREMAEKAQSLGYEYLAITDHSKRVSMANGLNADRLRRQIEDIAGLNQDFRDFRILTSCEVDILEDGSLDLADDVLRELDLVVVATHYNRNLSRDKQTERIIRGLDNPLVNILVHPTGRIVLERDPIDYELERVMKAAAERGVALELNAQPKRLDLSDTNARMASDLGVKLVISTDAHAVGNLELMRFGVDTARRAWLTKGDVLNTRSADELLTTLDRGGRS